MELGLYKFHFIVLVLVLVLMFICGIGIGDRKKVEGERVKYFASG